MKYNTAEKHLAQPEYGRNVQNLVDYCVTIEDREERNRCANAIISIMGNLYPQQRDTNDFKHILWDHLAIMSGFKLDVDYPYEVVKEADLETRPPRIPYVSTRIRCPPSITNELISSCGISCSCSGVAPLRPPVAARVHRSASGRPP